MVLKYAQRNARQALMLAGMGYSAGSSSGSRRKRKQKTGFLHEHGLRTGNQCIGDEKGIGMDLEQK